MTSNRTPDFVVLSLRDDGSGVEFAELSLTVEAFARLVQREAVPFVGEVRGLEHLGKRLEVKTVDVQTPDLKDDFEAVMRERVAPFEVDGWKADEHDMRERNMHKNSGGRYSVRMRRYVPKEGAGGG